MFIFEWLSNHKLQTNAELTLFGILVFMIIIFFVIGIIWGISNTIKTIKNRSIRKMIDKGGNIKYEDRK